MPISPPLTTPLLVMAMLLVISLRWSTSADCAELSAFTLPLLSTVIALKFIWLISALVIVAEMPILPALTWPVFVMAMLLVISLL